MTCALCDYISRRTRELTNQYFDSDSGRALRATAAVIELQRLASNVPCECEKRGKTALHFIPTSVDLPADDRDVIVRMMLTGMKIASYQLGMWFVRSRTPGDPRDKVVEWAYFPE